MEVIERKGWVIETIGRQRSGALYKIGFYNGTFYKSIHDAEIYNEKEDAITSINRLRKEYNDGTCEFNLYEIDMVTNIQLEKIEG